MGPLGWIPQPHQLVDGAVNVSQKALYGGLADLRPMPRTLIDEGELRETYHYRPQAGADQGRYQAEGDAIGACLHLGDLRLCVSVVC